MKTLHRPCAVCGLFYPGRADELTRQLEELFARVEPRELTGKVLGIIAPHAGYQFSGLTAAHAYSLLRNVSFRAVVIVSPSHREYFKGTSVYPGDSYSTPLGNVLIDTELRKDLLANCAKVEASPSGHGSEHAIEVQLPFLQHVLGEFKLLPVVVGDQGRENCFALGEALARVTREDILLVASTDLSHYHTAEVADRLDKVVVEDVRRFDYEGLMNNLETEKTEACGGGPTVAVMMALHRRGVRNMEILHHCNSGDVTGERNAVVGYLSAAAYA